MKAMAAAALMLALMTPAFTEYGGTSEAQQVCTPDVFRLCGRFIPDTGEITACRAAKGAPERRMPQGVRGESHKVTLDARAGVRIAEG